MLCAACTTSFLIDIASVSALARTASKICSLASASVSLAIFSSKRIRSSLARSSSSFFLATIFTCLSRLSRIALFSEAVCSNSVSRFLNSFCFVRISISFSFKAASLSTTDWARSLSSFLCSIFSDSKFDFRSANFFLASLIFRCFTSSFFFSALPTIPFALRWASSVMRVAAARASESVLSA